MAARDMRWNTKAMERIAAQWVERPVVIQWVDGVPWRGEAGRRNGVDCIKLSLNQAISEIPYTLFHEIAHLILHQSADIYDTSGGAVHDISEATAKAAAEPSNEVLERIRQRIAKEEREADTFAQVMLCSYPDLLRDVVMGRNT